MKPAPFDYVRPHTLAEACAALAADAEARLIAGGQTLVPMMAMRLARPTRLIDIARLTELKGIREEDGAIVMGAATRQVEAERSQVVATKLPLLAKAMPWIGHAPTRNRGTIGGSIANADPAAEIGLVLATLDGGVTVRDGDTTRDVPATELFLGPMTTCVPATGCITHVRFPVWPGPGVGVGFHEVSARKSDFAYVSAAAQVELDASGTCLRCHVGLGGATPVPTRLRSGDALAGTRLEPARVREALAAELGALEVMQDGHASIAYRRRVAAALAERAVVDACEHALAKIRGGRA